MAAGCPIFPRSGASSSSPTTRPSWPRRPPRCAGSCAGTPARAARADGCTCADLEVATARAAPAAVTVLAVGRVAPALPSPLPTGLHIQSVADPDGTLRAEYGGSPPAGGVIAILVKSTGEVLRAAS